MKLGWNLLAKLCGAMSLTLGSLIAHGATYQLNSAPFGHVDFTAPCTLGLCANYASTIITGSFSTFAPLAPNLVAANITPQLSSYSFSDSLTTFISGDANGRLTSAQVSTDVAGNITAFVIEIQRWQAAAPHNPGSRLDLVTLGGGAFAQHNLSCSAVGTAPNGTADACLTRNNDSNTSTLPQGGPVGFATTANPTSVLPAPTLSETAMLILACLIFLSYGINGRRKAIY